MTRTIVAILFIITLSMFACSPDVSVSVDPGSDTRSPDPKERDVISIDNCENDFERPQKVTRQRTVTYSFEDFEGYSVSPGGEVNIGGIGKVNIGTEIAKEYRVSYGHQETLTREIDVIAPPNTHMEYTIEVYEVWGTGTVRVKKGNRIQNLEYSFVKGIDIHDVGKEIDCPSKSGGVIDRVLLPLEWFDLDTGTVTQTPGGEDLKWDLVWECPLQGFAALTALNNASWFSAGVIDFERIKYAHLVEANYRSPINPQTGQPNLFYEFGSNVPRPGFVYYLKTSDGNFAKVQIVDYHYDPGVTPDPAVCRNIRIRYETFKASN